VHAILGTSGACVATHPSDMCVALAALDAVVHLCGASGERTVELCDLHRLPEDRPEARRPPLDRDDAHGQLECRPIELLGELRDRDDPVGHLVVVDLPP